MGEMRLMGVAGDTTLLWDPENAEETQKAKETWDEFVKGHRFGGFRIDVDAEPGEQVFEFDPKARKLIVAPPLAGG